MAVVQVVEGLINLIKENIIAKTNVVSNAYTGEILVNIENSFHFKPDEEIVLIDNGYNDSTSPHYQKFEYARIKEVNNTHWITLQQEIVDPSGGWYVDNGSFIQKTIGHSPLYDDRVYYGDREVIPTEEMAITVEPVSQSNEWIYIQGGLSKEYRLSMFVYGKDIETEQGMQILNKYTDSLQELFNSNIHLDINNYDTPLLEDALAGTTEVVIEDTATNREYFKSSSVLPDGHIFVIQDNISVEPDLFVVSVSTPGDGRMYLEVASKIGVIGLQKSFFKAEYGSFTRMGRYFYDSRIDNISYGQVQKGSAFIRAAKLDWFGKEVKEYRFPQQSFGVPYFKVVESSSSSES